MGGEVMICDIQCRESDKMPNLSAKPSPTFSISLAAFNEYISIEAER
jgi:hypothetical protein